MVGEGRVGQGDVADADDRDAEAFRLFGEQEREQAGTGEQADGGPPGHAAAFSGPAPDSAACSSVSRLSSANAAGSFRNAATIRNCS